MGGGRGSRLYPLTKDRCKPAVPLASNYRLVDIPISNCLNSGFNQIFVLTPKGQVIRLRKGQQLVVNLQNQLQEVTNIHTHGFFVSPKGNQDDIYELILPGGATQHVYQNTRYLSPGSYWYHPHTHPLVEEQVFGGMSGFIEVEGLKSLLPASLRRITD